MSELTISEARKALPELPEKLARTSERVVTITRRGQPVLAILPWEFYRSIVETLEILGNPEMVKALRETLVPASATAPLTSARALSDRLLTGDLLHEAAERQATTRADLRERSPHATASRR